MLNKMAENWVFVLMGTTTDRTFETIIEKDCGLEIDMFLTLVENVFSLLEYDVFSV